MASNSEQAPQQQVLSDHIQKASSTRPSDIENTSVLNTNSNMTDENHDPSSNPFPTKLRPKPVDARSAAASSLISSSLDSPKSATITNVSQRLPSTSVEVSVGEILSTDEKRASVSIREQRNRHSSSSCSSSDMGDNNDNTFTTAAATSNKMDLGEATRELTRLLHIGNDNAVATTEIHLNPDAPDFTPIDFSPTYRSELAPAHLYRRATQVDYYNNHQSRSRYYSESYHHHPHHSIPTNTSTIRPLLSLVPQYIPHHRQSWSTTTPPGASSNSWWQQEYSNPSSSSSSYHSRPAHPLYSPLMPPLTDGSLYPNRNSSKRQRIHSSRAFVFPNQITTNRKRSHSGPETPLQTPQTHLSGIHSLTRIMVDILRMIDPLPIKEEVTKSESVSSSNLLSYQQCKYQRPSYHYNQRSSQQQQQQQNESIDVEDVFVDDEIPTITASLNKTTDMSDEPKSVSTILNDNEEKEVLSLISTDTDLKDTTNITSTRSVAVDEPFYEATTNEESSTSMPTDAHTTN